MLIEITYNVTDVFMSTTETPVYVEISFEQPGSASAVWGSITGTLSNQTDLQNALNLKVPYTGATTNVNLGEYELKAGQVTLDTSPTGTAAVGTIRWNDTTGTSETTLKGGNVIIKNGVDLVARVVNKVSPNTTLTKAAYQAVRVSGAQGQRLAIELAQANNDAGSADTIGLVTENIDPNQEGFIMTVGQLEGINTTGSLQGETWVDGDVLYLSPTTAGAVTNVKPTAVTGHIIVIGYVEYAHQNNGKIYVKVMNGWELDELHNVSIVTPTNNQGLFYNSSNSLWENKTISTALGYTPVPTTRNITINGVTYDLSADRTYTISTGISGSGASGQVAYWTGTSAQSGSNNLFWDATNGRLGIGTNVPGTTLSVFGDFQTQSANANNATFSITTNTLGATASVTGGSLNTRLFYFAPGSGETRFFRSGVNSQINIWNSSAAQAILFSSNLFSYINTGANFAIGSTTDTGQRLQVTGDTLLKGSGNTSATTALTVQNSDGANAFRVLNNGQINLGNSASFPLIRTVTEASVSTQAISGTKVLFVSQDTETGSGASFSFGSNTVLHTSGNLIFSQFSRDFIPTSGTGTVTTLRIGGTINQTGGANGITRGLYVNPTLTSAADWRSIEWSNNSGWGLYGAGTANNYINGSLGIATTSLTGFSLRVSKTITGFVESIGIQQSGPVSNDVTTVAVGFDNALVLNSGAVTNAYNHFRARRQVYLATSFGTQIGFLANNTLTDATNNYGFYGDIPAATGRWNLYMNGTADNYLAGNTGIRNTNPLRTLEVGSDGTNWISGTFVGSGGTEKVVIGNLSTLATIGAHNSALSGWTNLQVSGAQLIFSISGTERMRLDASGNLGIGITPTVRLHVSGDTILRGSGATSATTALTVQNSSSTNIITIKNNRTSNIISDAGQLNIASSADGTNGLMEFDANSSNTQTVFVQLTRGTVGFASTAINQTAVRINGGFAPTSGTATWHSLHVNPTINQQGGANGITRGLYVNPTLTSAADFRAIETTSGKIVFGNLPTSSAGLPTGALWNDAGTVKIV